LANLKLIFHRRSIPQFVTIGASRHEKSTRKLSSEVLLWILRMPLLYGFLQEARSFSHRIFVLRERKLYRDGLSVGPAFQEDEFGNPMSCNRTRVRIQDMQCFRET